MQGVDRWSAPFSLLREAAGAYVGAMSEKIPFLNITLHYLAPVGAMMLLGLLGGKLSKAIKLPKVTGYLIMGIIIGPSALHLISHEVVRNLSLINDLALGLIMFAIGGVFEVHHLRQVGKKAVWLTLAQTAGALIFTTVGVYIVGIPLFPALLLGTIGVATAPAATLLVVREYDAKGEFTDTLITVVAMSNIIGILLFEWVFTMGEISEGANILYALTAPVYEIGGSGLIGFVIGYIISKWEQHVEDQAELLMIIVGGVILATGVAQTLGLQPLFATVIMGAVTTNLSLMHRLVYVEMRQIEQPLYIAFFVLAGASLHLELLPALGIAGVTFLITRVTGKIVGIYFVSRWKNFSKTIRDYLGLGMVVQAGVAIGLVDIVNRSRPDLAQIVTPIVLATVLIYESFGPPIIKFILVRSKEAALPE